ncbi:MAG TPA: hypothetical protein ENN03_10675 [bacterium]|nr:hypothetical protein [bacterium]
MTIFFQFVKLFFIIAIRDVFRVAKSGFVFYITKSLQHLYTPWKYLSINTHRLREVSMKRSMPILLLLLLALLGNGKAQLREDGRPTPGKTRLEWFETHRKMSGTIQLKSMRHQFILKSLRWKGIGPQWMSGRIVDVDAPLDEPFTLFAASASGGLWKTTNEGTTWTPVFDDQPSTTMADIAISLSDPRIIWAGTGENNSSRSTYAGVGVFKSTDGGNTWQHMGLEDTHHIGRIVIHPVNPDIVYVASIGSLYSYNRHRGVYKTTNGGKTWEEVLFIDEKTGIIDLAMDPADPSILYAAAWERLRKAWEMFEYGPGSGIYKTEDGGKTWKQLTRGFPNKGLEGRIGLAVCDSRPETIYASLDNHDIYRKAKAGETDAYGFAARNIIHGIEVYRSDDRGDSWIKVNQDHLGNVYNTYGYYFGQIRVNPQNAEQVWILGVPCMVSTDGGRTFNRVPDEGMHGDYQAMWIDPRNTRRIVMGNDGGLNISYDGGLTWKDIINLPVVQFYNVSVDMAEPFNVYGSAQDHGCIMGPSTHNPVNDNPYQWKFIPGGEASYLEIDPTDPDILYSENYYGSLIRSHLGTGETVRIKPKADQGEDPLRCTWLTPFILSAHDPQTLYFGSQYLHKSTDRGEHWKTVSPDLTDNDTRRRGDVPYGALTTISESPLRPGLIWTGSDDGNVHVTTDDGKTWNRIGGLKKIWVSRVEASRSDPSTVYVSLNGYREDDFHVYLYKVTDYGKTVKLLTGIPGGPVNVVRQDPVNPSILYVGTDMGVYVSFDEGESWNVLGKGLPVTFIHDLVIHPRDGILVTATHGRGFYTLDVSSIQKFNF